MSKPLVSVVIPVYNVEKYLRKCVQSVLDQTYKNIEIILVDDGSLDSSGVICDDYSKKYDFVKTVHKENQGLGMARNTGMDNANGDYVVFIDSDDWVESTLLESLLVYQRKYNVETVVSAACKAVNECGDTLNIPYKYDEAVYFDDQVKKKFLPRIVGRSPEKKDNLEITVAAALYSMRQIKDNNITFVSERVYMTEDLIFNIDYYSYCKSVCVAPVYAYNYFIKPGTLSTTYRAHRTEINLLQYELLKEKLTNAGILEDCKYRLYCQYFIKIKGSISQENIAISGFSKREAIKNIKEICNVPLYQRMIAEFPKTNNLGFKQNFFLFLVKNKWAIILYLLIPLMTR